MMRLISCFALLSCILLIDLTVVSEAQINIPSQKNQEGFISLFDGKTLNGWIGEYKGVKAKDGMIVIEEDSHGAMLTEKEYTDFIIRFDFRLHPGSNNGLIIRSPIDKVPPFDGMEIQILDNSAKKYANLKDYQYHGSLYHVAPAKRGFLKKVGEWNTQEVSCIGSKLKVKLNNHVILDIDMNDFDPNNTISKHSMPALRYSKGHIGFLLHLTPLELRNLQIKDVRKETEGSTG